jgi:hypothetical protein
MYYKIFNLKQAQSYRWKNYLEKIQEKDYQMDLMK